MKSISIRVFSSLLGLALLVYLTACGGGGSTNTSATSFSLSGTVAMGAPISGASVVARDVNGNTSNTVIADENGNYSGLDLTGLVAPIVIVATGEVGQTPYTLYTPLASTTAGTANVTTLTTALAGALGGGDLTNISLSSITAAGIENIKIILANALEPIARVLGIDLGTTDMVGTSFETNSSGIDKLLDLVDIRVRTDGISIVNKLQTVTEDQATSDRTEVRIGLDGQVTGTLPSVGDISLTWQQTIANQMAQCFALPSAQRVTYTNDAGGVAIPTSLHSSCQTFIQSGYLQNSFTFGERWLFALKEAAFDNAKFRLQLAYIVDSNGQILYVTNVHTKDSSGNGYTMPEVIVENAGVFKLRGNQRGLNAFVQPTITRINDYANPNSSSNMVAGRLGFVLSPHRAYDSATSSYKYYYDATGKPQPQWVCSWVTGPGLPGNGDITDSGDPVGGVLMKVPRSDYVAQQSYMAVHVKFPSTFNPASVQADRMQLLKACAARENTSPTSTPSYEVSTTSTFNFLTIDAAKTHQTSAFTWPSSAMGNNYYSWPGGSNSTSDRIGTGFVNYSLLPVTALTKALYKPTSMPIYTFNAFRVSDLPASTIYAPTIPVISGAVADEFFSKKVAVKARMLGAMPYLSTDADGVYIGNVRFGSLSDTTLSSFLDVGAPDIAVGGSLPATWSPALGATGIDRVGFTCYANWTSASLSERRWGPSVSSGNFGVPRNRTTDTFTLDDGCIGLAAQAVLPASGSVSSTSKYRDIWVRTYDQENRQIQQVMSVKR